MSCKGAECTVQHRNLDCKGGRHARELRAVIKERDQLKARVTYLEKDIEELHDWKELQCENDRLKAQVAELEQDAEESISLEVHQESEDKLLSKHGATIYRLGAQVAKLEDEADEWRDASGLCDEHGDPGGITPERMRAFCARDIQISGEIAAERDCLKVKVAELEHRIASVQYWLDAWDAPEPATTAQLVLGLRAALGNEP